MSYKNPAYIETIKKFKAGDQKVYDLIYNHYHYLVDNYAKLFSDKVNCYECAEILYKYALEKGTPVVEKAADEVRKQALKVVKEIEKKLESDKKRK